VSHNIKCDLYMHIKEVKDVMDVSGGGIHNHLNPKNGEELCKSALEEGDQLWMNILAETT
jgi:hypothetical protein